MVDKKKNSEKRKGLPFLWLSRCTMLLSIAFVVIINLTIPAMWERVHAPDEVLVETYIGDNAGDVERYTSILEADDTNVMAYYGRATAYLEDGYLELAREDYSMFFSTDFHHTYSDTYIEFARDLASAYYNRAEAYLEAGEYQIAIADYETAIELRRGNFAEAYLNLHHARYLLGQTGSAIVAFVDNDLQSEQLQTSEATVEKRGCGGQYYNGRSGH